MRFYEWGRIVKGVNTTPDVSTNEIPRQAKKFGNTVDKDGRPPTLSKKVKGKSTNVLFNLGLTEATDKIPVKAGHVLFSDWAKDHIAEHNKPGIGSVFSNNVNIENLISIIETLPVQGQGGPYTTKVPGIGYNLVIPYEEAKSLPDAQETTVEKQDRGQKFNVPAFKTSAPISQFKTDILTLIIVPSNPQYLPDDVKQDKEILNSIQRKESYSIVTAFPGDPNIPPVSQWNNKYAVVIPDQAKSEDVNEKWSAKYKRSINCSNPKGFSQKAHCAGRNKNEAQELSMTSEIYVDMDGVLADFFGDWAKLMGKDHWTKIDDISPALQKIRDTEDFWLNLPLTDNAKNLLTLIKDVKGEYNILSSPLPDDPNSEPHKREWIKKNLNFFLPKQVIITHDKAKYATSEDGTPNILIDDYGQNIAKWEAAGGIGFKHKDHKFERTAKAIKQHMQEPVEERELTKDEEKDKEKYVKGMKKNKSDFKKRYGDDAEAVMYATATKMAKEALRSGRYTPDQILEILENFADGKVKGKSKPGRVKRAGASCSGSVTELRQKAKNASGERAKMYHWCANMKAGRNK